MFKKLWVCMTISLGAASVYVAARGTPRVGTPVVTPDTAAAGHVAAALVSVAIPESKFIVASVWLTRIDAQGSVLSSYELDEEEPIQPSSICYYRYYWQPMKDDGSHGDAVANDRVFTRRVRLHPPLQNVRLRVEVSFKGVEHRVRAAPFVVSADQ